MKFYITKEQFEKYKNLSNRQLLNYIIESKQYSCQQGDYVISIDVDRIQVDTIHQSNSLHEKLNIKIDSLSISNRLKNILNHNNLILINDVVKKTEGELFRYKHLGRKQITELTYALEDLGLSLGMKDSQL